jgi:hypothetical protein
VSACAQAGGRRACSAYRVVVVVVHTYILPRRKKTNFLDFEFYLSCEMRRHDVTRGK